MTKTARWFWLVLAPLLGCPSNRTGSTADPSGPARAAATGSATAGVAEVDGAAAPAPEPPGPKTVFETTSEFSHFLVRDFKNQRGLYFVRDSGEIVQESEIDRDAPYRMVVPYTRVMFASYFFRPKPTRSLIVGLGGGSMVLFLRHYDPEQIIDAVEIDPAIVEAADKWFGVKNDDHTNIVTEDAFVFLKKTKERYDVIYMDAFLKPAEDTDATGVPLRMKTGAFLRNDVISRLKPNGVVTWNLNAHPKMQEDLEIIRNSFPQTYRFVVPGTANVIVVGSTGTYRIDQKQCERVGKEVDQRFNADFSFEALARHLAVEPPKPKK
jgi:spermidine synthase